MLSNKCKGKYDSVTCLRKLYRKHKQTTENTLDGPAFLFSFLFFTE